jgi:hypothetical protein
MKMKGCQYLYGVHECLHYHVQLRLHIGAGSSAVQFQVARCCAFVYRKNTGSLKSRIFSYEKSLGGGMI